MGKLWVAAVLLVGLAAGLVMQGLATLPFESRPDIFRPVPEFNPDPSIILHIIITTMEVVLLAALVVVYIKIYSETRANFALGLTVVLSALLLQTLLSYPLILGTEGTEGVIFILVPGTLTILADFLTLGAYMVFLYLSLE